jgi:serine/threonine-protein kinase HipA
MAEASERRLAVLMAGRRVGVISQGVDGRFSLEYGEQWRLAKDATPLSLSMPLARRTHPDAVV